MKDDSSLFSSSFYSYDEYNTEKSRCYMSVIYGFQG